MSLALSRSLPSTTVAMTPPLVAFTAAATWAIVWPAVTTTFAVTPPAVMWSVSSTGTLPMPVAAAPTAVEEPNAVSKPAAAPVVENGEGGELLVGADRALDADPAAGLDRDGRSGHLRLGPRLEVVERRRRGHRVGRRRRDRRAALHAAQRDRLPDGDAERGAGAVGQVGQLRRLGGEHVQAGVGRAEVAHAAVALCAHTSPVARRLTCTW